MPGEPGGVPEEPQFVTRFAGILRNVNHKSETQLESWKELAGECFGVFNRAFNDRGTFVDPLTFAKSLLGMHSDHSEDQKKLSRLMHEWKDLSTRLWHGTEAMKNTPLATYMHVLWEEKVKEVAVVGGQDAYDGLSVEEKDKVDQRTYHNVSLRMGDAAMAKLPESDKRHAQIWIWAGCCMHKEMNATKGGASAMAEFWKNVEGPGPMVLYNRDLEIAASSADLAAREHAVQHSSGGAVKLTSLAGMLFRNKDDKRGYHDRVSSFMLAHLYRILPRFPDTSNTRFQSYLEASIELLIHRLLYLSLLEQVRDMKVDKQVFNHMESNVYAGLSDIPTLTEMAVMALYFLAISHPYMVAVRADSSVNALDLGDLHNEVKNHCDRIIERPSLLLAPDASPATATLNGGPWGRPDAYYAVLQLAPTLPNLEGCLVAFFRGARETWVRFMSEYASDSVISNLSTAEKSKIFLHSTNDRNEGGLGHLRQAKRSTPNSTMSRINAEAMYKRNNTREYMRQRFTEHQHHFIQQEARRLDALQLTRQHTLSQAEHDREAAAANVRHRQECAEKERQLDLFYASLVPELDPATLAKGLRSNGERLRVPDIKLQIRWHRRQRKHDKAFQAILLPMSGKKRDDLLAHLVVIVHYHLANPSANNPHHNTSPDTALEWSWEDQELADMEDMDDS